MTTYNLESSVMGTGLEPGQLFSERDNSSQKTTTTTAKTELNWNTDDILITCAREQIAHFILWEGVWALSTP